MELRRSRLSSKLTFSGQNALKLTRNYREIYMPVFGILCFLISLSLVASSSSSEWEQRVDRVPRYNKQKIGTCQYPCKCPNNQPNCKAGVSMRKDGCDCCFICTRQQGDLCDARFICDEDRDLYCDFKATERVEGICRAKQPLTCDVDGKIYKDGETFQPNCRQLCTCQNGHYSCTSRCPWEDNAPSTTHCKRPRLVKIEGKCCKEWVCPPSDYDEDPIVEPSRPGQECTYETTNWSQCTHSCGMGQSIRLTNENPECQSVQERRLCLVRPCDQQDTHLEKKDCKSTWKLKNPVPIMNGECESIELHKLKYCSTCKKGKCCGPGKTKTRQIEFRCPDEKVFTDSFMWIKNCECFKPRNCPFT